jgi:hypothetical protein
LEYDKIRAVYWIFPTAIFEGVYAAGELRTRALCGEKLRFHKEFARKYQFPRDSIF